MDHIRALGMMIMMAMIIKLGARMRLEAVMGGTPLPLAVIIVVRVMTTTVMIISVRGYRWLENGQKAAVSSPL